MLVEVQTSSGTYYIDESAGMTVNNCVYSQKAVGFGQSSGICFWLVHHKWQDWYLIQQNQAILLILENTLLMVKITYESYTFCSQSVDHPAKTLG